MVRDPVLKPTLPRILGDIGAAGAVLARINAAEGSAGNISVFVGRDVAPPAKFSVSEPVELPRAVPELSGGALLVTGSGSRLRELADDPSTNLGWLAIERTGRTGTLYSSPERRFARLTSELISHLAVHQAELGRTGGDFHVVIHAQPRRLTYLTHIDEYRDPVTLNRRILRWQPETIINLPGGMGVVPFLVPGTAELMEATVEGLSKHCLVVWSKHGVVARSSDSVQRAADLIEYVETAAHYEYLNLLAGDRAPGLTRGEIERICAVWSIDQRVY